ncbi:hypothetical protein N7492_009392 [Penicillium capsulatum]|uniref:Phosphatidylglycerol lysyltransferase C-terminal domain-containing protein n=1 Tax=Penicillium capsulatum TaxID=69766 RepID=A0A9W9HX16_9EURO|nr:hypothetical protein N7492_009392 [Penicillium capsulatum]KAJ6106785.1 hypothetical protein N7512_010302 [Penicillium capsulatum]
MAATQHVASIAMSNAAIDSTSTSLPKKKRGRRGGNTADIPKPRKTLLLDELGDALVDQLYTSTTLDDRLDVSHLSVIDHLRHSRTSLTLSSGVSLRSGSSRTLTGVDSTPPTSLDDRVSPPVKPPPRHDEPLDADPHQADVFSLGDFSTMTAIQSLTAQYGRVAHMGILDHSYRFFVNKARSGALSFKIQNRVAIVGGDPLCGPDIMADLLDEFTEYRRRRRWGIAFMGASESFIRDVAQPRGWATIRFGTERVLNPQTNDVLLERGGKRITVQNRQLLHPQKGGITLGVYAPTVHGTDTRLQAELIAIYDAWRARRNDAAGPQAFITVYDPFALPALMTFVYSRDPAGRINGFAALRRLGGGGYHIDPCIAAPGGAKGISDLLIVAAMALLHRAGVSYLGFGFEPVHLLSSDDITGMSGPLPHITRDMYRHAFQCLPISGKKAYHDKFRPDPPQDSGLYLVFPGGVPGPRHLFAMVHMANISLRKVLWADLRQWVSGRKRKSAAKSEPETVDAKCAVDSVDR